MKVRYATVHVTATKLSNPTTVEDVRRWHTDPKPKGRGWSAIGYHHYIDQKGNIFEGRPENRQGAHVGGHNWQNLGICLEGGLDENGKPANTMTEAQEAALLWLFKEIVGRHGIPWKNIRGHRDWGAKKACPCFDVQSWLREKLEL